MFLQFGVAKTIYDMSDVSNISQNEINVIKNSLQFVMMNLILLRK